MSNDHRPSDTAARLADRLAAAIKGAATGGVYGAAVGAAKAFLPEIIKAAVIVLVILLVLPTLIFAALPNILFGYENASATDIIDMTDKAYSIDAVYQQVEQYSKAHIDQMVEEATLLYSPDETDVTSNLSNINIYWFIAISSVAHKQDLYTMADEQSVALSDTDGEGWYNTDYGDIAFTDSAIPVVYYNQTDARWGNLSFGKSGTIGTSGCGPTALAIAVATFVDESITPAEVADWAVENGYRCEGVGSYHSLIPDGGAHYGLMVEGLGGDGAKVVEALEAGKLVIAIMSKGHFTSGGHFIVLRGTTSDGKILVADPASVKRSNQAWNLGIIVNEANRKAGAGGPFWALSPG